MKTSRSLLAAILLYAPLTALAGWDCTTKDGKLEAILAFGDAHYGEVSSLIYASRDGMFEVYFYPYRPDPSEDIECTGWVQVDDECRVLNAEGRSLDDATLREKTLPCS